MPKAKAKPAKRLKQVKTPSPVVEAPKKKKRAAEETAGEPRPGMIVETETGTEGKQRNIILANFFALEKNAVYMTRGHDGVWFMNTKTVEHVKDDERIELVYIYDGPFR